MPCSFEQENLLFSRGIFPVAGIDEAGRGPLAGPVVAAAVVLPPGFRLPGLDDSKKLSAAKRERLYAALTGPSSKFPGNVKWNFGKFLIGSDGSVLARFEPGTKPEDPAFVAAITAALKKP